MSEAYTWIKLLHVVSSVILFGTGLGTASRCGWPIDRAMSGPSPPFA